MSIATVFITTRFLWRMFFFVWRNLRSHINWWAGQSVCLSKLVAYCIGSTLQKTTVGAWFYMCVPQCLFACLCECIYIYIYDSISMLVFANVYVWLWVCVSMRMYIVCIRLVGYVCLCDGSVFLVYFILISWLVSAGKEIVSGSSVKSN